MRWPRTEVMGIGRLRNVSTLQSQFPVRPVVDYIPPAPITVLPKTNILKQIAMNGLRGTMTFGLGRLGDDIVEEVVGEPVATTAGSAMGSESNKLYLAGWSALAAASSAASLYHGYRRNNSWGWGAWWFVMGAMFPIVTPTVAFAQGFGKRAGR